MTHPEVGEWPATKDTHRRSEVSSFIGRGDAFWGRAGAEVLNWKVKTESGFTVDSTGPATPGEELEITARFFGLGIVEPVRVLEVIRETGRVGFSYATLPGHPVDGEEAFVVERRGDEVHLIIRSLTRAAPRQPWKVLFPALLVVQRIIRRRYLRALRQ